MKKLTVSLAFVAITACGASAQYTNIKDSIKRSTAMKSSVEYVDMGLPSGTLWGYCNWGASNPGQPGEYFAWGEIVNFSSDEDCEIWEKNEYTPDTSQSTSLTLHDISGIKEYDPCVARMPRGWQMPTREDWEELLSNTKASAVEDIDISEDDDLVVVTTNGIILTSNINGNQIFLPAAGYIDGKSRMLQDVAGAYLSATANNDESCVIFTFTLSHIQLENGPRYDAFSLRPVSKTPR